MIISLLILLHITIALCKQVSTKFMDTVMCKNKGSVMIMSNFVSNFMAVHKPHM